MKFGTSEQALPHRPLNVSRKSEMDSNSGALFLSLAESEIVSATCHGTGEDEIEDILLVLK